MLHIHKLDKWKDVLVFNFGGCSYLLQAQKCLKCNKAFFSISAAKGKYSVSCCDTLKRSDLEAIGFFAGGVDRIIKEK